MLDDLSVGEDFEVTISSGHGGFHDDISEGDQGVSWAGGAILVWNFEEWGFQSFAEIEGFRSVNFDSVFLEDLNKSFKLFIGTINNRLVFRSQWVLENLGHFRVLDTGVV